VAYVSPPQRPGAQLWSIAAGPLVNVVLIPVFAAIWSISWHIGWNETHHDAYKLFHSIWSMNLVLLVFNMMPVYPLDGGQILRSLLWFPFGRVTSLFIAAIIGMIAAAGFAIYLVSAYLSPDTSNSAKSQVFYLGIMSAFILMNCWGGLKQARALARVAKLPRREGFTCPSCKTAPPIGAFWRCGKCGQPFDLFLNHGTCPNCSTISNTAQCLDCGASNSLPAWNAGPTIDV